MIFGDFERMSSHCRNIIRKAFLACLMGLSLRNNVSQLYLFKTLWAIAVRHSSVGTLRPDNGDVHETFGNYLKSPSRLKRREFRLGLRRVQAEMVEFMHLAVPVLK